jgi:hypothetical protein
VETYNTTELIRKGCKYLSTAINNLGGAGRRAAKRNDLAQLTNKDFDMNR